MQGSLNEIDIRSLLQLIELGQRTGELMVQAYSSSCGTMEMERHPSYLTGQCWLVFSWNGRIIYAGQSEGSLQRLRDYLRRYQAETVLSELEVPSITSVNAPEYGYLWVLLENQVITPNIARNIVHCMVQETLFDLLSLHQGAFIFEMGSGLAPQLVTLEISPLLADIFKQVQEWKKFHPHITSPNQCPLITDRSKLQKTVRPKVFESLNQWADGQTSIRQISRYLHRDIVTVAKAIYPFVQQGLVQLLALHPENIFNLPEPLNDRSRTPRIVCIDDDLVIRETVEIILREQGYEATAIGNPLKALSLVFQLKPDLILCDIAMPELNGYEICAMLRNSTAFRQTPIIMLTGIDGFIDRLKARMVRATNYLTKPFGDAELLTLVETYIGPGKTIDPSINVDLEDEFMTELETL
ncbi:response regulator [Planktothrix paucivesiculata]|uniref:Protein PatA n=1 Tax=Planktothrix paucivesiculata PCC 9631 TaxID=671071 RepID=A0A7Z9BIK8_9CYAN|nr:response regulator [Planktothrix paucivesiculata]VXD14979.1 Response regulator receiver domain protein (CheY) [Planktothrix paucivesiculata PCC 9631]